MQAPEVYWVMIVSEIVPYTTSYSNILMLGTYSWSDKKTY